PVLPGRMRRPDPPQASCPGRDWSRTIVVPRRPVMTMNGIDPAGHATVAPLPGLTAAPCEVIPAPGTVGRIPSRPESVRFRRRHRHLDDGRMTGRRPHIESNAGAPARQRSPWMEPLDLTRVLMLGELVAAGTVVALRALDRPDGFRAGPRAQIQMGPGGWVSMRGGDTKIRTHRPKKPREVSPIRDRPALSRRERRTRADDRARGSYPRTLTTGSNLSAARRPWWAVLLGARPADTR